MRQHVRPKRPDSKFKRGAHFNLQAHEQLPVQWDPKIRSHISPIILLTAGFGAVTPFAKANVFLHACAVFNAAEKLDTTQEQSALTCDKA